MNAVSLALIWPGEPAARQRSRAERHLQELMLFLSEAHSSLSATVRPVSAAVARGGVEEQRKNQEGDQEHTSQLYVPDHTPGRTLWGRSSGKAREITRTSAIRKDRVLSSRRAFPRPLPLP